MTTNRNPIVSPDLERHYNWRGDRAKAVKADMVLARQAAGRVKALADNFVSVLTDEQRLALSAAQSALSRLAHDLDEAQRWAKAKDQAAQLEREQRERDECAAAAAKRWPGGEPEMRAEADDLCAFMGDEGKEWAAGRRPGVDFCVPCRPIDSRGPAEQLQRLLLQTLEPDSFYSWSGSLPACGEARRHINMGGVVRPHWDAGLDDFEAFKKARRDTAGGTARAVNFVVKAG